MYQTINEFRKIISSKNIVYINFEDDRLYPLDLHDLALFPESYYELFPEKKNEKVIFLFDEIQVVENWEKFVRRLYDTEICQIFISGSSSKMLSSEIATSLRGRTMSFEVFPLSFKEYLNFNKIEINLHSSKNKALIVNNFNKYIHFGGFPELIDSDSRYAYKILHEYIDLIIYKDLLERYKITNHYLLKYLVKYCFVNISTLLSFNKLFNELKSQGIQLSKNTLYNYFEYLEEAFAVFTVPVFSRSVSEQSKNPKKIYSVDVGFKSAVSIAGDIGNKYENIVFLHIRNQSKEICYWKSNQKIDFIFNYQNKMYLVNVSYDISANITYKREIEGLLEGMNQQKCKESFLLTSEREEVIKTNNKIIHVIPVWKWLLIFGR